MTFKQFDEFISVERGVDDWGDDAIIVAESIMSEFSDGDWRALIEVLGRRDAAWRENLAQCLDSFKREEALTCLYSLLDTDDYGVFIAAAASIAAFDIDPDRINVEQLKSRYESFSATDSMDDRVFSELLQKL